MLSLHFEVGIGGAEVMVARYRVRMWWDSVAEPERSDQLDVFTYRQMLFCARDIYAIEVDVSSSYHTQGRKIGPRLGRYIHFVPTHHLQIFTPSHCTRLQKKRVINLDLRPAPLYRPEWENVGSQRGADFWGLIMPIIPLAMAQMNPQRHGELSIWDRKRKKQGALGIGMGV